MVSTPPGFRLATNRLATTALVAAVAAAGSATAPAHAVTPSWSQHGYGPGNTGYNPYESILDRSTVKNLSIAWSRTMTSDDDECHEVQRTPVFAAGRVFTSNEDGINAENAADGWSLWVTGYERKPDLATNLAVAGNVLIATVAACGYGPAGTTVYGIHVATGQRLWSTTMPVNSDRLVIDRGIAVVGGRDDAAPTAPDQVAAFRVSDGVRQWVRGGVDLGAGVSAGGTLLLTRTDNGGALAVDIATGAPRWKTTRPWSALAANPAGDRLYVSDPAGALTAVKASSGAVAWRIATAAGQLSGDGRRLYVARGRTLSAYDAVRGRRIFSRTQPANAGRPVLAGGLLYCVVAGHPMAILDPATGAPVASGAEYRWATGQPVIAGGQLYLHDWRLIAYSL